MGNGVLTGVLVAIRPKPLSRAARATRSLYRALTLVATGAFGADWPTWGYDAAGIGAAPAAVALPETLHLQWTRQLPPPRRAWPKQMDDGDKVEFDLSYSPPILGEWIAVIVCLALVNAVAFIPPQTSAENGRLNSRLAATSRHGAFETPPSCSRIDHEIHEAHETMQV